VSEARRGVAILGATGHVGKCLTSGLLETGAYAVTAVVRDASKASAFLATQPRGAACAVRSFEAFSAGAYGAVVNCVGVGTPGGVTSSGAAIFELTERFDRLVMDYLAERPETRYVSFSSGAAYCGDFAQPASEATAAVVPVNDIRPTNYYGIAKLAAEAKHRAAADLAIVDFRLFGLFSRHIDVEARFFMTDVFRAIAEGSRLAVGPENIVRDYIDPEDLIALLVAVLEGEPHNDVYDLYSAAPVAKFDLLADFSARYGLAYDVLETPTAQTATGIKPNYFSTNRRAASLGFAPARTSLESLVKEIDVLLEVHRGGQA
jgi:nucleoside-diphosphate-sugar epimerase